MASTYEAYLLAQINYLQNNTPVLFATTTLGATTVSVTMTVPSGASYNRLQVYWRARAGDANAAESLYLRMNGDTGSHYLWQVNQAQNAGAVSGTTSGGAVAQIQIGSLAGNTATASYFASGDFVVDGAVDLTNFATAVGKGAAFTSATNSYTGTYSGQYIVSGTAITSLTLFTQNGTGFMAGSVFSMYGLS